jgi:hypothetical protein
LASVSDVGKEANTATPPAPGAKLGCRVVESTAGASTRALNAWGGIRSSVASTVAMCETARVSVPLSGLGLNLSENAPGEGDAEGVALGLAETGGGVLSELPLPQAVKPDAAIRAANVSLAVRCGTPCAMSCFFMRFLLY